MKIHFTSSKTPLYSMSKAFNQDSGTVVRPNPRIQGRFSFLIGPCNILRWQNNWNAIAQRSLTSSPEVAPARQWFALVMSFGRPSLKNGEFRKVIPWIFGLTGNETSYILLRPLIFVDKNMCWTIEFSHDHETEIMLQIQKTSRRKRPAEQSSFKTSIG